MLLSSVISAAYSNTSDAEIKLSDKICTNNRTDGFFSRIVGDNSKHIYALFFNHSYEEKIGFAVREKYKVILFNKKNMKREGELILKGFGLSKEDHKKVRSMYLINVYVKEDFLYVLWALQNGKVVRFYVQVFNKDLKSDTELKKVYERPKEDFFYGGFTFKSFKGFLSEKNDDLVLVSGLRDKSLKLKNLDVVVVHKTLETEVLNRFKLPVSLIDVDGMSYERTVFERSKYDGDLYFTYEKNDVIGYGRIDLNGGHLEHNWISSDKKITSVNIHSAGNQIQVFGTCKKENEENGDELSFYSFSVDKKLFMETEIKYTPVSLNILGRKKKVKLTYQNQEAIIGDDLGVVFFISFKDLGLLGSGNSFLLMAKTDAQGYLLWSRQIDLRSYGSKMGNSMFVKKNTSGFSVFIFDALKWMGPNGAITFPRKIVCLKIEKDGTYDGQEIDLRSKGIDDLLSIRMPSLYQSEYENSSDGGYYFMTQKITYTATFFLALIANAPVCFNPFIVDYDDTMEGDVRLGQIIVK